MTERISSAETEVLAAAVSTSAVMSSEGNGLHALALSSGHRLNSGVEFGKIRVVGPRLASYGPLLSRDRVAHGRDSDALLSDRALDALAGFVRAGDGDRVGLSLKDR